MKPLRFPSFLFFAAAFLLFSPASFAQGFPDSGSAAGAQASPASPATLFGEFLHNPFAQQSGGTTSHAPQLEDLMPLRIPDVWIRRLHPLRRRQPVDRGIFLDNQSNSNACGTIVSYNFSPGTNPRLESVTTCTPQQTVVTRRAHGEQQEKPLLPQLVQTK
jgi:hypothetical protein